MERFCTALDCVNTGFIPDGILDELPLPTTLGTTRIGGIDLNKARARFAVAAAVALSPAPAGFTVADLAARARAMAAWARTTTPSAKRPTTSASFEPRSSWSRSGGHGVTPCRPMPPGP